MGARNLKDVGSTSQTPLSIETNENSAPLILAFPPLNIDLGD